MQIVKNEYCEQGAAAIGSSRQDSRAIPPALRMAPSEQRVQIGAACSPPIADCRQREFNWGSTFDRPQQAPPSAFDAGANLAPPGRQPTWYEEMERLRERIRGLEAIARATQNDDVRREVKAALAAFQERLYGFQPPRTKLREQEASTQNESR